MTILVPLSKIEPEEGRTAVRWSVSWAAAGSKERRMIRGDASPNLVARDLLTVARGLAPGIVDEHEGRVRIQARNKLEDRLDAATRHADSLLRDLSEEVQGRSAAEHRLERALRERDALIAALTRTGAELDRAMLELTGRDPVRLPTEEIS